MGEIAEMMLNGTMCECCGVFLDEICGIKAFPVIARRNALKIAVRCPRQPRSQWIRKEKAPIVQTKWTD